MQAQEIRGMPSVEVNRRLDDAYQEMFNLRFQWVTGQLKNSNRLTAVKRDIARMKTILREHQTTEEGSPS
jgi:large subunit ribosomal protein L29